MFSKGLLASPANADAIERKVWQYTGIAIVAAILAAFVHSQVASIIVEVSSTLVLVTISIVCRKIFDIRHKPGTSRIRGPAGIWWLIALGFLFLALDEALSIHEAIDYVTHWLFRIDETDVTDRLDDLIVLGYGVVGVIILFIHRSEFTSLTGRAEYTLLAAGFLFLLLMVAFDTLTNRNDMLALLGYEGAYLRGAVNWLKTGEELSKLVGESAFLLAFLRIYRRAAEGSAASPIRTGRLVTSARNGLGAGIPDGPR